MSNFITRTLSGAVYVALVVLSIFVHPIFFGVLFSIITILAVREYHHLVNSSAGPRSASAGTMWEAAD